jgi:uncharacterized protein
VSVRTAPWEPGTPCWYDLTAVDLAGATSFYRAVFGWDLLDTGEEFGHYTFCLVRGMPVAGIGTPPVGAEGQPAPAWTTYLAVEDADKTATAVAENGGTLLMPPMAIADQGRTALAVDPAGGMFGLWEAGSMFGAVLVNEPGGVVWNDHRSADPAAARAFYTAVFGYRYSPIPGHDEYVTIDGTGPGNTIGALAGPDPDLPPGVPAHWMTHFSVESVDDAADRATAAGGTVVRPPADLPYGRSATLRDPQGTYLKVGSSNIE